jgi:hypothetical protein
MSHGISVAHITNRGDILYAAEVVDSARIAISYKTYHSESWSEMQAKYQSRDPSAILGSIQILPLGSTSYFISYSTHSGETMDALGVIGINVVLKSVLYSSLLPFTSEEIENVYSEFITLGGLPKKKTEMLPVALENYRLTQIMLTGKNSVILAVEQQETPTDFHRGISMNAMPWDFSINEEKAITSGDLLLFCYSDGGELLWKKSLRKWQTEMGTNLGLSYEADIRGTGLNLLGYIGKDFFGITIDVGSGLVTRKLDLLPGKNMLFTKRYSCWLDAYSVVLCGISPLNDGLRKLMLVEF